MISIIELYFHEETEKYSLHGSNSVTSDLYIYPYE